MMTSYIEASQDGDFPEIYNARQVDARIITYDECMHLVAHLLTKKEMLAQGYFPDEPHEASVWSGNLDPAPAR